MFDLNGRPVKVVKYATVVTEEKLRQADHQGQIAAINKAQCVIAFDLDGGILDANDNFLDAVGYRLAEVRGGHHRMFEDPGHAAGPTYAAFWAALAAGRHQAGEYKHVGKHGRELWLRATYNPIFDLNGRPFRVVEYATDITAEKLHAAEVHGQLAAINKSQGVISFAMDGTVLDANDRFLHMIGYEIGELRGRHHSLLLDPAEAASAGYAAFWDTLRAGTFVSGLYRCVGRNREVWIQASYNPILDLNGRPFKVVKFATDVSENVAMSEAYEDAKRQSQHDTATALPNRARLATVMAEALSRPDARLACFYLDLDRFKPINDTYGHHAGDRVLGEIADRLRRALSFEQLAARVGGDEFVVVAPDLADEEVETLAQRLVDAVTVPVKVEVDELRVGVSIGIAVAPADGTTPDELLRAADSALCRSKQAGRSTFSFHSQFRNDRLQSYRNLVQDLRRGLGGNQFLLEYQPRFDAGSQAVRGLEALLRWNHPERGRVPPLDFIAAAERSGLIVPIGEWVLRTACRTARAWPSAICISVNVSPVQFRDADVVELVQNVLAETGLEPHRLELEITEGV
ncbi:MAG: diguanylate cyclase, partial [Jatrophihabitans endophyticus]|nr:diguanylate cyclase [Jatrophihabitans endophyticus]